jgi:hypothetical protein
MEEPSLDSGDLVFVGVVFLWVAWIGRDVWLRRREVASLGTGSPTVSHGPPSATESDKTCCLCGRTRARWARLAHLLPRCPECKALYCADCRALLVLEGISEEGDRRLHWCRKCDHEWRPWA